MTERDWGIALTETPEAVWPISEEGARETAKAMPGRWIIYSRPRYRIPPWERELAEPRRVPGARRSAITNRYITREGENRD